MSSPGRFINVMCGLINKGYVDFYGRTAAELDAVALEKAAQVNHTTAARSLKPDPALSEQQRRLVASAEFLTCDSLFKWRRDLEATDAHTCNGQICDVRSNIILSTPRQAGGQEA